MNRLTQQPTLSLCMIVKNEVETLARCLESVKNLVDEIVIVDTGSEDGTLELAAAYQAVILHHPWQNDFAQARNFSLEQARGDWILVLDADEELESDSRQRLRPLLVSTEADGLLLAQRSLLPPGSLQKYEDLPITRLFRRRAEYRYEQPIHEQIRPAIERQYGLIRASNLIIWHYGYAQPSAQGQGLRAARNLPIIEQALANQPNDPYLYFQLGTTHKALGHHPQAEIALRRALEVDQGELSPSILDKLHMKLAQIALASDNYQATIHFARQSLARNPGNLISLYLLALAYMFQGQSKQAFPYFKQIRAASNLDELDFGDLDTIIAYCHAA